MKHFPPFRLDTVNQCLWRRGPSGDDERILLTPKALAVLRYLVDRAGRLVTQNELLEAVWPNVYVQPEVLKYQIADIRSALLDNARNPTYIETLSRRGYRFIAPVTDSEPAVANISIDVTRPALVGRDKPLSELHGCLKRMLLGQRQIVFITGEPGIGKTAVADEFQRRAGSEVSGIRIARGQCVEGYGGKEPYYPMLEAIGHLCRNCADDFTFRTLVERAPTWAIHFPGLLKAPERQNLQREVLGSTSKRMLREICEALEAITAEFPVVLIFEDLQWADPSTLDLISALGRGRERGRLMLIATKRPVDAEGIGPRLKVLKQELAGHHLCCEIRLQPLAEADVAEYLAAGSQRKISADRLAALIYRRSEGNPLFMIATLEELNRRGLAQVENGSWRLTVAAEEANVGVPETLRGLIEAWISRLHSNAQAVLEVGSVTGVSFSTSISAPATNLSTDAFDETCEALVRRTQMIRPAGLENLPDGSVSPRYEFAHAVYREVFYNRQTPGRRARSHALIGKRLETVFQTQLSEVAAQLAHHFEQAGDWPRAVRYLQLVAQTASRRFAPDEATATLRRAYDLCSKLVEPERATRETRILEDVASLYTVSFDMRVLEVYRRLRKRAAHYGLLDIEVRALIGIAYPLSWTSTRRCLVVLDRALRLAASSPDPIFRARARASCLVRRLWASGWNTDDVEACREAIEEIRAIGDASVLRWHLVDCNFIHWCSSEYREAYQNAVESLPVLLKGEEENPYPSFVYWLSQFVLPWSLMFLGNWGEALKEIEAGIRIVEKNGDHYRAQTLLLYRAWVHLEAMDFARVVKDCDSLLPSLASSARTPWRRFCTVLAASADAAMGNFERALDRFAAVRAEMSYQTVIHDWYCRMLLQAGVTDLWIAKGDTARARQEGETFLEVTLATAERTWQARAWETNARIAMAQQDLTSAEMYISRALVTIEGFEAPLAAWRVHRTAAEINECLSNSEGSATHCETSRSIVLKLANSLDADELLKNTFLETPTIRQIVQRKGSETPRHRTTRRSLETSRVASYRS